MTVADKLHLMDEIRERNREYVEDWMIEQEWREWEEWLQKECEPEPDPELPFDPPFFNE